MSIPSNNLMILARMRCCQAMEPCLLISRLMLYAVSTPLSCRKESVNTLDARSMALNME